MNIKTFGLIATGILFSAIIINSNYHEYQDEDDDKKEIGTFERKLIMFHIVQFL